MRPYFCIGPQKKEKNEFKHTHKILLNHAYDFENSQIINNYKHQHTITFHILTHLKKTSLTINHSLDQDLGWVPLHSIFGY
jgi:hypothetical protein